MRRGGQPQNVTPLTVLGDHAEGIRKLKFRRLRSGFRIAHGIVAADGSIVNAGSGDWTITKDLFTSGVYLITFDPAFATVPAVTATVTNDDIFGDGPFIATLDPTRDESSVTVRTWAVDGDPFPFDALFDFHAVAVA